MASTPDIRIILSPHFDDAVFSLGGLMVQAPAQTMVVTVFAGAPHTPVLTPWDRHRGFVDSTASMTARAQENDRALALLGLAPEHRVNLPLLADHYRSPDSIAPGAARTAVMHDITDALATLLVAHTGKHIALYLPLSAGHGDHALLRDAAMSLQTTHSVATAGTIEYYFYQDLPYAYFDFLRALPLWLRRRARRIIEQLPARILRNAAPRTEVVVVPLTREVMEQKIRAAREYRSQIHGWYWYFVWVPQHAGRVLASLWRTAAPYSEIVYRIIGGFSGQ